MEHAGSEVTKPASTKIAFNVKNIINPTGVMLMVNIVSIILDFYIILRNLLVKLLFPPVLEIKVGDLSLHKK